MWYKEIFAQRCGKGEHIPWHVGIENHPPHELGDFRCDRISVEPQMLCTVIVYVLRWRS